MKKYNALLLIAISTLLVLSVGVNVFLNEQKISLEIQYRQKLKAQEVWYKQLEEQYQQLGDKYKQLEEQYQQLEDKYQQLEEQYQQLEDKYQQLEEQYQQLEDKYQQLENRYYFRDSYPERENLKAEAEKKLGVKFDDDPVPWHPFFMEELISLFDSIPPEILSVVRESNGKTLSFGLDRANKLRSLKTVAYYSSEDHAIVFSEEMFFANRANFSLSLILGHEIGHAYLAKSAIEKSSSISNSEQIAQYLHESGYLEVSGWSSWPDTSPKVDGVPTFGSTNPEEDFAQTFSLYIFSPQYLQTSFPERYNWMREKIFTDIRVPLKP